MEIRRMTLADYPAAAQMMQQLHALHVAARPDLYVPMEPVYSREEVEKRIGSADWICLLAADGETPAGLCFAQMRKRTCMVNRLTAYIDDLFVLPSYRRQGVATALFCAAEESAREKGAERMDLMVWSFNQAAIAFYESLGMTPQRLIFEKPLHAPKDRMAQ